MPDSFATLRRLPDGTGFYSLPALGQALDVDLAKLPVSLT